MKDKPKKNTRSASLSKSHEMAIQVATRMNTLFEPAIDTGGSYDSIIDGIGGHVPELLREDPLSRDEWRFVCNTFNVDRASLPTKEDIDEKDAVKDSIKVPETIEDLKPSKVPVPIPNKKAKPKQVVIVPRQLKGEKKIVVDSMEEVPEEDRVKILPIDPDQPTPKVKVKKRAYNKTKEGVVRNRVGIGKTIIDCLICAGENGTTKARIHATLVKKYPDRDPDGMMVSVNALVPAGINRGKNYIATKISKDRYTATPVPVQEKE